MRKRSESALDELTKTYEMLRGTLLDRLEDVDTEGLQKQGQRLSKQGYRYAGRLREQVERRVRPRPSRRLPVAGALALGLAAGLAVLLYDRRRRDMISGRLTQVQVRAREAYSEVGGVSGAVDNLMGRAGRNGAPDEASIKQQVEQVIAAGGAAPAGLQVAVEGRTVYLRGQVDNPAFVDAAAERAHTVEGVVAVVNLTTGPSGAISRAKPAPPKVG